MYKVEKM